MNCFQLLFSAFPACFSNFFFRGFNISPSAIVSSDSSFTSLSPSSGAKSSSVKPRVKLLGMIRTFIVLFWSYASLLYWAYHILSYFLKSLSYNLEAGLILDLLSSKSFFWYSVSGLMSSVSW